MLAIRPLNGLRAALIVAASVFFALGAVAHGSYAAYPRPSPPAPRSWSLQPQDNGKPSAIRGRAIYNQRCASCHGTSGRGEGRMAAQLQFPPPDFTDVTTMRTRSPEQLFRAVTEGNLERFMPPWQDALSQEERWDVVYYVWSLATSREAIEEGRETYSALCADCHGREGRGDGPQAATLSTPPPDFTDPAILASKSQADLFATVSRGKGAMPAWEKQLAEEERWAVLEFVRTFSYQTADAVAEATGQGIILVQIVNATQNADPDSLAGLEATLHRFFGDESIGTLTGQSDGEGHVRFEGLPTDPDYRFGVRVRYQGVEYGSELVSFPEGSASLPLIVNVFETTQSDEAIRVYRTHLIFDFLGQGFRVAELYIIGNEGDRTFVGSEDRGTLRFTLPQGATGLTFEDERLQDTVMMTEEGFVDTLPVPPGGRQVLLSYILASQGEAYRFARRIVYPTDNINVLVPDVGAVVKSDLLTEQETVAAGQGQRYLHLAVQDLAPGTEFVITFDKLPRTVPTTGAEGARSVPRQGLDMGLLKWVGVLVTAAGVGFAALAYPLLRRRGEAEGTGVGYWERERNALIQAIADLDDQFDAGGIPEVEYEQQRARLKERLIQVTRRLRGW